MARCCALVMNVAAEFILTIRSGLRGSETLVEEVLELLEDVLQLCGVSFCLAFAGQNVET